MVCLLNGCASVSLGDQLVCRSIYNVCNWKDFLLNVTASVSWGHQLLCRSSCTMYSWRVFLPKVFLCVSWGKKLLCRRCHTVCSWSCTLFNWNVSVRNDLLLSLLFTTSVYDPLLCVFLEVRKSFEWEFALLASAWAFLLNGLEFVSWGHQLVWRRSCTVWKQKASPHCEPACGLSD